MNTILLYIINYLKLYIFKKSYSLPVNKPGFYRF